MSDGDSDQQALRCREFAEQERRAFLKERLEAWRERRLARPAEHSLHFRILDELTRSAARIFCDKHPNRRSEINESLSDAEELADQLRGAADAYVGNYCDEDKLNYWKHDNEPEYSIRIGRYPRLNRVELEGTATDYLNQNIRSQLFDRNLVDMLIALELYQFAHEMKRRQLPGPHPLLIFIRDNAIATFGLGVIAATLGAIATAASEAMNQPQIGSWGLWIVFTCFVIWIVGAIWSALALPLFWSRRAKARNKARELLSAMLTTYASMNSDAVISAKHVMDNLRYTSQLGVIWPSPLYVLLEDVIGRGGRL